MEMKKKSASTKAHCEQMPLFPKKESPYYKCFVFNEAKDVGEVPLVKFTTLVAFIFDRQVFSLRTWTNDFLMAVCDELHKWNSSRLYDAVRNNARLIRPFYRERIATLDNPVLHKSSGIWIERTMDANASLKGGWNLCKECGAPMERIVVIYEVNPKKASKK